MSDISRQPVHRDRDGFNVLRVVIALLQLFVTAIVLILAAAFVLGLLGANPEAGFASWIYGTTEDLMTPFNGIFDPIEVTDDTQIRTSLLFAIVVYAAVGAALGAAFNRLREP